MKKLVVLSGAGISAESGIKTFRDNNGLWEEENGEDVASIDGWRRNRGLVIEFYNKRRAQLKEVEPNDAHKILASLENNYDIESAMKSYIQRCANDWLIYNNNNIKQLDLTFCDMREVENVIEAFSNYSDILRLYYLSEVKNNDSYLRDFNYHQKKSLYFFSKNVIKESYSGEYYLSFKYNR